MFTQNRFDENDYNQILGVIQAQEQHKKLAMIFDYNNYKGMIPKGFYKKMAVWNDHSNLSIFWYNYQKKL